MKRNMNKGVILAGGYGTRLFPLTKVINKHFLPIFDKPMIYYSLSILLLFKIENISIVCNPEDEKQYINLLGNGEEFGVNISYAIQNKPEGIPHGIKTGIKNFPEEDFLVILGDNFLYGREFFEDFQETINKTDGASIFCQKVVNPEDYGVALLKNDLLEKLVEKPKNHVSDNAIIGLYKFDDRFNELFKNLKKSDRNEFEIIDILYEYGLKNIKVNNIGRGSTWFDMGSFESFFNASLFVKTIQERQGMLVSSPHEIAYKNGSIDELIIEKFIEKYKNSSYTESLKYLIN